MSKLNLPVDEWFQLGSTEGAEAREFYIKDNADYYTVVWRENMEYKKLRYPKETKIADSEERQYVYEIAFTQAQFAANYRQRPVMIFGVIEIPDTTNGYDSLVAIVKPNWSYPSETPSPRQDS